MSIRSIVLNYLLLGWFSKLPLIGHLWFVTMIVACYLMFAVLRIKRTSIHTIILIITVCLIGQIALDYMKLPSHFFLTLMVCGIAFIKAHKIVQFLQDIKISRVLPVAIIWKILYYSAITHEMIHIHQLLYFYIACISGALSIVVLFWLFNKFNIGKVLAFISAYSYQIYIVHHPFSRKITLFDDYTNCVPLSIFFIYLLSFALAYILKIIADLVRQKLLNS